MKFTENSLFLGVDSLRLFEYLRHFRGPPKAMVDIATYVAVNQDIRIALGLVENLFVAGFFSYDPKDDYEREQSQDRWPRLKRPFYLTRGCNEFLSDPYLALRSKNSEAHSWEVDDALSEEALPAFEKIEIESPFRVSNARWLRGTIRTNSYGHRGIAAGLLHRAREDDRHHHDLHRVKILVADPDGQGRHAKNGSDGLIGRAVSQQQDPVASRYDGVELFAIDFHGLFYREDYIFDVRRSFESDEVCWELKMEVKCDADVINLWPSDHTLLQSTLTAVLGADLARLAYLVRDAEFTPDIICRIKFIPGNLGGLQESMELLTSSEGFWQPIPPRMRDLIRIIVE
jgi:hypothetical protein